MTDYRPVGEKSRQVLALPPADIEIYEGAVRSSKTVTSLIDWVRHLRQGPAGELAMIGRTERTVYRNLIAPLIDMLGSSRVAYNRGLGVLNLVGRDVYVIGANNEAATAKIQGMTLVGAYCDELATMPESFFNMTTSRLSVDGARLIGTCNPEGTQHWLKTKWLDKATLWLDRDGNLHHGGDRALRLNRYTYTIDDNPYLSQAFKDRLRASYTGIWYRRFILSEWTNAEGAIYDGFDPDLHVKALPDGVKIIDRIVGIDYGTVNALAAIMLGLGDDRRLYILDEWRHDSREGETRWTDAELSRGLRRWLAKHDAVSWVVVDPSAASFIEQLHRDGVRVDKADNAVIDGIRRVASLLAIDRLQIVHAPKLVEELPGYAWDAKAQQRGEDKPLKENDHSADAMRYAVAAAHVVWHNRIDWGVTDAAPSELDAVAA